MALLNNAPQPILAWRLSPGQASTPAKLRRLHFSPEPESLDAACRKLPGGAYTTLRTFGRRRSLRLEEHFSRLEESAALAGHTLLLERQAVRRALRTAVQAPPGTGEFRLRLIYDFECEPGVLYIVRGGLVVPPAAAYRDGVAVITSALNRSQPDAKLTSFMAQTAGVSLPPGVNEALLISHSPETGAAILEGMSSNFFAVRQGVLWTAGSGVLAGITRSLILEVALKAGIPLRFEPLPLAEISDCQEAFISSTSRSVLPVVRLDETIIGAGVPGPVTLELSQLYLERVAQELEAF